MPSRDYLRRCVFRPYRKGMGPVFYLTTWDTGRYHPRGTPYLGYRLKMQGRTLFEGEDYSSSPLHSTDGDETVKGIMTFLTLRPGDTDREYFDAYTPEQMEYCQRHAEYLGLEVMARFGRSQ